ncbi:hypothetical protein, partial [Arthrobacter sp. SO3]|uniref:hypothetical protein n=1 Tax=Arthrobacter sp. SO3 TaxID=1897057 RepID=UPI001CFFD25D
ARAATTSSELRYQVFGLALPSSATRHQILRQRFIKSEIERHSVLPAIPSAQEAQRHGQYQGNYDAFLVASGLVKLSVELPADPSPQERVAWQLVPAFLNEYGHRYPHMTPKLLVAAWTKVMTTQTASGQLMVDPMELRLVVEHMAKETGEQFNPKMMAAHALPFRIEIQNGQRKAPTMEYPGRYFDFHPSVAETPAFVPTVWVDHIEFPTHFPASSIDDETLDIINRVVHYRYMTERAQGFTAPMARFLAEVLLTTVIFRLNTDNPLTKSETFHTAYRFSHRYIQEQRPHESKYATVPDC